MRTSVIVVLTAGELDLLRAFGHADAPNVGVNRVLVVQGHDEEMGRLTWLRLIERADVDDPANDFDFQITARGRQVLRAMADVPEGEDA